MAKVADEFDKGDGLISAKEFMNALRFDPKKRRYESKTESERIHEEIARETSLCTCARRYPIQHIFSENSDNRVQYGVNINLYIFNCLINLIKIYSLVLVTQ